MSGLGRFPPQLAIDLRLLRGLSPSEAAAVRLGAARRQRRGGVDAMTLDVLRLNEVQGFRQEL